METQTVTIDDLEVRISRPVPGQPKLLLIESNDGRLTLLGDDDFEIPKNGIQQLAEAIVRERKVSD